MDSVPKRICMIAAFPDCNTVELQMEEMLLLLLLLPPPPLALLLLCGGRFTLHLLFVLPHNPTGCSLIRFCAFRSSNLCSFGRD